MERRNDERKGGGDGSGSQHVLSRRGRSGLLGSDHSPLTGSSLNQSPPGPRPPPPGPPRRPAPGVVIAVGSLPQSSGPSTALALSRAFRMLSRPSCSLGRSRAKRIPGSGRSPAAFTAACRESPTILFSESSESEITCSAESCCGVKCSESLKPRITGIGFGRTCASRAAKSGAPAPPTPPPPKPPPNPPPPPPPPPPPRRRRRTPFEYAGGRGRDRL